MAHALTLQDWLDRLKPADTPIFSHTKAAILALEDRYDSLSARDIASLILSDPLATLRLIYLANNRSSRHFGNEIATVEHAVMMQGVGVFLEKVRDYPVLEDTELGRDSKVLHSIYRLLRMAQHAAWQARDFAVLHADVRAEEVQVAALLHYAPEFLFWLDAPETAKQLALLRRRESTAQAEVDILGFELGPLRLMLLEAWKIPENTRDLLDPRYAERNRQRILRACLEIANHSRHGWWDDALLEAYQALSGVESTPIEAIISTAHANAVRVARHGHWILAPAAATWLPLQPGPWPPDPDETVAGSAPGQAGSAATAGAAATSGETGKDEAAEVCLMPDRRALDECLRAIDSHLDGSYTLNQMLAVILKGLNHGLGLTRIVFAMTTPDGLRVKSRFTIGVPTDDALRHFEFLLASRDLFGQLMGKMQGIWLNADNRAKFWPLINPHLREVIAQGDFYAMSLHAAGKPAGLIYADRGHGNCALDPHTYSDFKMLCLQAAKGLGKLKSG